MKWASQWPYIRVTFCHEAMRYDFTDFLFLKKNAFLTFFKKISPMVWINFMGLEAL